MKAIELMSRLCSLHRITGENLDNDRFDRQIIAEYAFEELGRVLERLESEGLQP